MCQSKVRDFVAFGPWDGVSVLAFSSRLHGSSLHVVRLLSTARVAWRWVVDWYPAPSREGVWPGGVAYMLSKSMGVCGM